MDNHIVTIENREKMIMTEILDVDSFDEEEIKVILPKGAMIIKGEKLHIQLLDLKEGKIVILGTINSVLYTKIRQKGEGGFLAKVIK